MKSKEYRNIIAVIIRNSLKKEFPGLRNQLKGGKQGLDVCNRIAAAIHARMYGANVDGIDCPIWRDAPHAADNIDAMPVQPKVLASELLKEDYNAEIPGTFRSVVDEINGIKRTKRTTDSACGND